MAKLRSKKEEKEETKTVTAMNEVDPKEVAKEDDVKEMVEAEKETAIDTKSEANPASDKEAGEAAEVQALDVAVGVASNHIVEKEVAVADTAKKGNPNVRIKPNQDIRTYVGNQWYNLKKGKQETVPQSVKVILQNAGMLDAL